MTLYSESKSQSSIQLPSTSRVTSMPNNVEGIYYEQLLESFFFPLFTEISRRGHLPKLIFVIQMIILFLQEASVTMWCGSALIYPSSSSFIKCIYCITDWGIIRTESLNDCIIQYSIGICLFLFSNLFLVYVSFYYHTKRLFLNSQIILLRFILYPLLDCLLPFYSSLVGRSFVELANGKTSGLSITFFVISILILAISLIELNFSNMFSTNTPVIDRSLIGSWDDEFIFMTLLSICCGSLCSQIFDMFPKWLHFASIAIYIILIWYRIYLLYFIPMHRFFVNSLFLGGCIMSHFNLLFAFVHLLISTIPTYLYILIAIVTFIGGVIFSNFYFEKKKKKRLDCLSYSSISIENLNNKNVDKLAHEQLDQIVFSSELDAISYLRVGIAFHADMLIDFTFLRYLMENYAQKSIIFAVSKVASFFPFDPQFLSYCLSVISGISDLSISQNYLLYQIRRIHVVRQSSVSHDATNQLNILQKMSRDTISQVRGFWSEILNAKTDISFASLQYLRKITLKTDSAFIDARDKFPNNVSILSEYCRFQIEGMGDFSGAIISGKKILQLNQGENLMIDHAFRSLVNVYPNYLLKNILNSRGDLLKKEFSLISDTMESTTSTVSSISTNSSSSSQIEFKEKYEEIISQLYSNGKLRVSLQSRMKSTHLKSLTTVQTWSAAQLLCCIFIYLILILYVPELCNVPTDIIQSVDYISQMNLNMHYISSIAAIQEVITSRGFIGSSALKQILGLKNSELNLNPSLMEKPFVQMQNIVSVIKKNYNDLIRLLMDSLKSYTNEFPEFYDEIEFYRCENDLTFNISLRSAIALFISDAEVVSSYGESQLLEKNQKMIELMLNVKIISQKMNELQNSMRLIGEKIIDNSKKTFFLVAILFVAICFVVFGLFRIFNLVSIFKQAKKCSDILRKTNPEIIKQSFLPISKMSNDEFICGTNVHNAHEVNIWLVTYPIVVILSILIAFAFVLASILLFSNELTKTKEIFGFFHEGTIRFSSILNSLITFCLCSSKIISEDEGYESLNNSIELLKKSQEILDISLMNTNDEMSSFYFTQKCDQTSIIDGYSHYLSCLSVDNKINMAYSSILILSLQNITKKLNNDNFASLVFISDMYLTNDFFEFQNLLVNYSNRKVSLAILYLYSLNVSGLLISCLVFLIEHLFSRTFIQSVEAVKQLILMLPPVPVVSSSILMNFISNNDNNDEFKLNLVSAPDSIISETTTAAILIDKNFLIQAVNSAVNATTGFTPDQILGQKINWLIPYPGNDDNPLDPEISMNLKFYETIESMLNDNNDENIYVNNVDANYNYFKDYNTQSNNEQNSGIYNNANNHENDDKDAINDEANADNLTKMSSSFSSLDSSEANKEEEEKEEEPYVILMTKCLTENGSLIPTKMTVMHLEDESKKQKQIVLLFRDLTKEAEQEAELKEAKNRTERLLQSIIPEKVKDFNTQFVATTSTVILIQFSGLTEYVHTLSPETLMRNLKTIYNSFEEKAKEFPCISIIKKDSELLVACCGLFDHINELELQASQAILYCKKMLDEIENINEDLDQDIHLKIAVNMDGPSFGKMLNDKTPSFELLTPATELANNLIMDGNTDVIQIGGNVAKYLDGSKFEISDGIPLVNKSGLPEQTFVISNVCI